MRKLNLLLVFIVCIIFSCKQHHNEKEGKTIFRYNEAAGITSLDPAFSRDQANIWITNQIFNGLVQLDQNLAVQPCIAHSWQISGDKKSYTFFLNPEVYFHDSEVFVQKKGRRVVASDIVFSLQRLADPAVASPGAWIMNMVEQTNGKLNIEALNDTTLTIHLSKPFPPFLSLLSMQYCSVVAPEAVKKFGKDFRVKPVGTGPFYLQTWSEGNQLILLKNENYFETDETGKLPHLDAVVVSFISDKQAAFLEFLKGNLDFISGIDASYKDELLTRDGKLRAKYTGKFRMNLSPYLNTEYIGFLVDDTSSLVKNHPTAIKEVRQAINYGFDKARMIKFLRNNIGIPGHAGFVPAGLPSFSPDVQGYSYDPQKARQLLQKAGFPGGKGLPLITLSTTGSYLDLSEYLQGQLAEIGIRIKIDVNQAAAHREMVAKSKLLFFRGSWIADYPDAENYLALFYSPNYTPLGPNYTHYKNPEYDKLYQHALNEVNDTLRYSLYRQLDQIIINDAPVVVLYYDQVVRLVQNRVGGLNNNALNLLVLKHVQK